MTSKTDAAVDPSPLEAARQALQAIGETLAKKPEKDDAALSESTQKLATYREALIREARAGGAAERTRLEHVNAVLSVVTAVHFPLGDVPWERLAKARAWLADLIGASGAAEPEPSAQGG